jgi:hypothetical protein
MAESGLAALKRKKQENKEREEARNRPKAEWFKFPKGVTAVRARFLQEIDAESANYNPERGLAVLAIEHEAPGKEGFKKRANCTLDDEGRCLACSRHKLDYKAGWRQRQNFYVNALIQVENEEPKVYMLSRNFNSPFVDQLMDAAEDDGTITDKNFRITKTGEGTKTNWILKELKDEPFDDAEAEVFSIEETALRQIPFERQEEWYGSFEPSGDDEERRAPVDQELADW